MENNETNKIDLANQSISNYNFIQSEIVRLNNLKSFKEWNTHLSFKMFPFDKNCIPIQLNTLNNEDLLRIVNHLSILNENHKLACSYVIANESDFPEFNHMNYTFGQWIQDIRNLMQNNSNREALNFFKENEEQAKKMLDKSIKREIDINELTQKLDKFRKK